MSIPLRLWLPMLLAMAALASAADSAKSPAISSLEAAQAALDAGDYSRAIQQAETAAADFQSAKDPAHEALARNVAGSAYLHRGEYDLALGRYRRALTLDRQQHDAQGEITRLSNIGSVYFFRGRYLEALTEYEKALQRAQEANGQRQLVFTNLAMLYEQLGQDRKALDYYQQALALGPSLTTSERGQLLSSTGTLYRRMGDPAKALESYRAAQDIYAKEHISGAEIRVLEEIGITQAVHLHDLNAALASFTQALQLANATGTPREIAGAHLYRGEALYRMNSWAASADEFRQALTGTEQWTALYGLGRVQRQQGRTAEAAQTFGKAIGIIEGVRGGAADLAGKSVFLPRKRDVYDAAIALELTGKPEPAHLFTRIEQARAADPGTLPAVQAKLATGSLLLEYWIGEGKLAVLWANSKDAGLVTRDWTEGNTAAALSTTLLQGVPLDSSAKQLIIVPDGPLVSIPFETLGSPLLVERFPISYLPNAALLLREQEWRTPLLPWRSQLAAFGDPTELTAIARSLPGRVTIHAGADSRKSYLFDHTIEGVPLLHFATHAVADANDANRSHILFSSGYLFRGEIQDLPLSQTDLVTLSASEGEGVQSLSTAFLAAGARSTVTTLWKVPDEATADFMGRFYSHLAKGESKAAALRNVKLNFLHSGTTLADPKYWAAFVLSGTGQAPIRPVLSWLWLLVPAGVAAAAMMLKNRR
jgi:tetratricopeptide (TPR) repeat protein